MLSDPQRTKPAGHVSAIDPLRGMAALAVALFHFTNNGWLPPEHWLTRLGFFGHYGVRTFLVISGFVVPYAMWMGGYTVGSLPAFLARRFTRIHRTHIVNLDQVAAFRREAGGNLVAELKNGTCLQVSRTRAKDLRSLAR